MNETELYLINNFSLSLKELSLWLGKPISEVLSAIVISEEDKFIEELNSEKLLGGLQCINSEEVISVKKTNKIKQFIKENYFKQEAKEIAKVFKITESYVRYLVNVLLKEGELKERKAPGRMIPDELTSEDRFMIENYKKFTKKELAKELNKNFNTNYWSMMKIYHRKHTLTRTGRWLAGEKELVATCV